MSLPAAPAAPSPGDRRKSGLAQRAYRFLVSPALAIAILVVVLACCLLGVTVWRGVEAGRLIFATLWFNALLVLLAISSAAAFFTRIWRRRLTLLSVGMIVFHLSFLGVLAGVVLNGLFSFRGTIRLTEGETVALESPAAYDDYEMARFFDPARLAGHLTLLRLHVDYKVDGDNKRAASELDVRAGARHAQGVIYPTEYLDFGGVRFFSGKEGYSVLLVMSRVGGAEMAGGHLPLQSIRQADGGYLYSSGTAAAPGPLGFPPDGPVVEVELNYWPGLEPRTGKIRLRARPVEGTEEAATALVGIGERAQLAGVELEPREIRYWVGLGVRYDPGLHLILASLTLGSVGMGMIFVGRVRQGAGGRRGASGT